MGQSWVYVADVRVPADSMAAYLAARISASSYNDWPSALDSDDTESTTVAYVLDDLAKLRHTTVVKGTDAISVRAIVTGDSDGWLEYRTPLAAAIRAASLHGGTGELAICGWKDSADRAVVHVTATPGASTAKALRGKDATALRKRAYEGVRAIQERIEAASLKDAITLAPPLDAIHAGVVDSLASLPEDALLAAARQSTTGFTRGKGPGALKILVEHFPARHALLDALRRGYAGMTAMIADRIPATALQFLRFADARAAMPFGRAYLDAGAPVFIQREAAAAAIPFDDGPRAVLDHVRAHVPSFRAWAPAEVTQSPMAKTLVARADAALCAEARAQLPLLGDNLVGVEKSFELVLRLLAEGTT